MVYRCWWSPAVLGLGKPPLALAARTLGASRLGTTSSPPARRGLRRTSLNWEKLIPKPVILVTINNAARITIINNNNDGPPEGAPAASG